MNTEKEAEFTLIELTKDCKANDGVTLNAGVQMLAVLNKDGTLNLYACFQDVTPDGKGELALTGNCFLRVMPPEYTELRKVTKSELVLIS